MVCQTLLNTDEIFKHAVIKWCSDFIVYSVYIYYFIWNVIPENKYSYLILSYTLLAEPQYAVTVAHMEVHMGKSDVVTQPFLRMWHTTQEIFSSLWHDTFHMLIKWHNDIHIFSVQCFITLKLHSDTQTNA